MEAIQILQAIGGFLIALFVPGFLIVYLFFEELEILEKISLSIALSITTTIFMGIFLGYNEYMKNLTGGITQANVWKYSLNIILTLSILCLGKIGYKLWSKRKKKKKQ
ncbi:hypothetical protein HOD20_05995 [archaeon]|jgi:uncharacterized membrane protein|nr:hypothetical protein [archaeon]MBT4646741.1 hypothetical protein [archaeon]MBT6822381.1 hypothetical protein [archaeon]MBT7392906.1 hypothetical protein [archaeon]